MICSAFYVQQTTRASTEAEERRDTKRGQLAVTIVDAVYKLCNSNFVSPFGTDCAEILHMICASRLVLSIVAAVCGWPSYTSVARRKASAAVGSRGSDKFTHSHCTFSICQTSKHGSGVALETSGMTVRLETHYCPTARTPVHPSFLRSIRSTCWTTSRRSGGLRAVAVT